jgi:transporter family-2 protein
VNALLAPLALSIGGLLAVQAAANLQLSTALGSPVRASTAQLAIGTAALIALAAAVGTLGALGAVPAAAPWHLVGGLGSAIYITAGILLFPRLGALGAVGLFITGQMLASLAVDGLGLLGVAREGFPPAHVLGGVAVLGGAAAIVRASRTDRPVAHRRALQAFAVAAGVALAIQGPINAQLRADLDAPVTAGAFSFLVATATMIAVLAVWQRRPRPPRPGLHARAMPWWGWLGGLVGATYVTVVPLLIGEIGAAATIGLTVAGQQLVSLTVDRYGLLRLPRRPLTLLRTTGVALLLAGVALIQFA